MVGLPSKDPKPGAREYYWVSLPLGHAEGMEMLGQQLQAPPGRVHGGHGTAPESTSHCEVGATPAVLGGQPTGSHTGVVVSHCHKQLPLFLQRGLRLRGPGPLLAAGRRRHQHR